MVTNMVTAPMNTRTGRLVILRSIVIPLRNHLLAK
jgi:hypothetical protein